jgi:hypothetical protein
VTRSSSIRKWGWRWPPWSRAIAGSPRRRSHGKHRPTLRFHLGLRAPGAARRDHQAGGPGVIRVHPVVAPPRRAGCSDQLHDDPEDAPRDQGPGRTERCPDNGEPDTEPGGLRDTRSVGTQDGMDLIAPENFESARVCGPTPVQRTSPVLRGGA